MKNLKIRIYLLFFIIFFNNLHAQVPTVDYDSIKFWSAHPLKKDMSDSIPGDLSASYRKLDNVDVFYIHPTTYTQKTFQEWNASLDDENLNQKTDASATLYQASVFNEAERLYAPRYRQAHIKAFYIEKEKSKQIFDVAYEDVKAAFVNYLEKENKGRPFIIASHSQGTVHAGRLIHELIETTSLSSQLVCAYLIGMPVPDNYFTSLKPCQDSLETGCFVSWRTYKRGYIPDLIKKEKFKAVVVNPINWKTSSEKQSKQKNLGAIMRNFNKLVPNVVDAEIQGNVLWSCKPDVFGKWLFFKKDFHIGDINLFYQNIRMNMRARTNSYFLKINNQHVQNPRSNL
jgi:hypothetical protein